MHKRFLGRFLIAAIIFTLVWEILLPFTIKRTLHTYFLALQMPVHRLKTSLNQLQARIALNAGSKNEWIQLAKELAQENAYLRLKLHEQTDQIDLSQRVLELNKVCVEENFRPVIARVLYRKFETWSQFFIIDKGSKDGLEVGQGVICSGGIVGKISEVKTDIAFVELVTNPAFRLLVKIENDTSPHTLMGCVQISKNRLIAHLTGLEAEDAHLCPRQVETTFIGQQFPNHISVGQLAEVELKSNEWIGTVHLGNYLQWLDEICVLVSIKAL